MTSRLEGAPRLKLCYSVPSCFLIMLLLMFTTQCVAHGDLRNPDYYNDGHPAGDYQNSSSMGRFKRDISKLETAIKNFQPLARITNGICLVIGLVTGDVKSDELLPEILNIGKLKVDDFTNLNQSAVDEVLNALIHNTREMPKEVLSVEDRLIYLESLREISPKFKDLPHIPGQKEYEESLEKVKKLEDIKQQLTELIDKTNDVKVYLNMLEMYFNEPTVENIQSTVVRLPSTYYNLVDLEKAANAFSIDVVTEAKKIQSRSKFIDLIFLENKLRRHFNDPHEYYDGKKPLVENFENVSEKATAADHAHGNFETIRTLMGSRKTVKAFKYSFGLPEGPDDLGNLYSDTADRKIADHGTNVQESLRKIFEPFIQMANPLQDVWSKWTSLMYFSKDIDNILDVVDRLADLSHSSESIPSIVANLTACENWGVYPSMDTDELEKLRESMISLSQNVSKISSFDYLDQFKNLSMLKSEFDLSSLTEEEKTARATSFLKNFGVRIQPFFKSLMQLYEDIQYLSEVINYPKDGIDMNILNKNVALIDDRHYKEFLSCLRNITTDGFPVKKLVEFLQDSRRFSPSADADRAISNVIQSQTSLKSALNAAEAFHYDWNYPRRVSALKSSFGSNNYMEVAENLGRGVQGLLAIRKVWNARLGDLVGKAKEIQEEAKKQRLPYEQQKSLEQLGEVQTVLDSIKTFLRYFNRKRSTIDPVQIFKDAQDIPNLKLDMKTLRHSMEALNKTTPYQKAIDQLDDLEGLDMEFARFKMEKAVGSVEVMDQFFVEYSQKVRKPSPTPRPAPPAPSLEYEKEKMAGEFRMKSIMMVAVTFILTVILIGGFTWCVLCRGDCCKTT